MEKINRSKEYTILSKYPILNRLGIAFSEKKSEPKSKNQLPITYSKNPDFMSLAGIWKDKPITQEQLRQESWGKRL